MTNIINTLGVDTLSLRGAGAEFNSFSRFFKSKEEALASVANGDYVPTPGVVNAVLMMGEGIMVYDFTLLDFVNITELSSAANQSPKFIELDGANDYVSLPTLAGGSEDVLDWTKSWSVGITLVGIEHTSDALWMSLFSSGGNHITLRRGGSNWGLYVTSNDNGYQHGANTWYAPAEFDRILLTYDHLTTRLKYYLGNPATGTYAMRANLLVNSTVVAGNSADATLSIGKGAGAIINWDGGINNLVISNQVLVGPQVDEFFQTGEDFTTHEYYPDLTSYCRLGEDTFPAVVDDKGNVTGGILVNGTSEDFADVPTVAE
jgi:hypothetical protein